MRCITLDAGYWLSSCIINLIFRETFGAFFRRIRMELMKRILKKQGVTECIILAALVAIIAMVVFLRNSVALIEARFREKLYKTYSREYNFSWNSSCYSCNW